MGMYSPDMPDPIDPKETAAAQTATNFSTAIANQTMGNVNEVTPYGNKTFSQSGTTQWTDPNSGTVYDIPNITATQTLSPEQQKLFNKQTKAETNLAGLAADQSKRLSGILDSPVNLKGAPKVSSPDLTTSISKDFSADRKRVEKALMSRMQPYLKSSREQQKDSLSNSGIKRGSDTWHRAMRDLETNQNDARMGAIINAGQEQSRLFGDEMSRASFGNTALQQQFGNDSALRGSWLNEQYAQRNQPINEIAALLGTGQVQNPTFTGAGGTAMPTVDYAGLVNQNWNQQATNAQAKQAGTNAMLGGLFGLGSAGITAAPWGRM